MRSDEVPSIALDRRLAGTDVLALKGTVAAPLPEHVREAVLAALGEHGVTPPSRGHLALREAIARSLPAPADPEREILRTRLNDGKVDRQGRFVAGYMDYEEKDPLGGLYRLDPDLTVTRLDGGIIVSNGPCFSLDGATLYFADSWTR